MIHKCNNANKESFTNAVIVSVSLLVLLKTWLSTNHAPVTHWCSNRLVGMHHHTDTSDMMIGALIPIQGGHSLHPVKNRGK